MRSQLLDAKRQGLAERGPLAHRLASSDTGRSAGLAAAVIVMNVLALVFTVVFARILGPSGYGSLAVLVSAFIILMVPGSALQIATAREVSRASADGDARAGHEVRLWLAHLAIATVAVTVVAIPLRGLLAQVIAVDDVWAAASVPVTGMLWAMVCVMRGALQGLQRYKLVGASLIGEALGRLAFALLLVAVGLDVTGAFLGQALALSALGVALYVLLVRGLPDSPPGHERPLTALLGDSWAPVTGLTLLFLLQEAHVIVVKHDASSSAAGSYAVAAVAAKAIIWVAVGLGMYLLPEASRRSRLGTDARPILFSTLGVVAAAGIPMVLVYSAVAQPLLTAVFGADLAGASGALPYLGLAMSFLACSYLCVQYLLAIGRRTFIPILAVAVVADIVLLANVGADLTRVAIALCVLQGVCAATLVGLCVRPVVTRDAADARA